MLIAFDFLGKGEIRIQGTKIKKNVSYMGGTCQRFCEKYT
jgi:hypothetical protein